MSDIDQSNSNMPGGKKPQGKRRFNFNLYWIYGLILIIFIGMQLFSSFSSSLKKTNPGELEKWMIDGDVQKIVVYNKEYAEVYIKENSLEKDQFKDVRERSFGGRNTGPHYRLNFGDMEFFQSEMKKIMETYPETASGVEIIYDTRENYLQNILAWILPLGIVILIWVFLMRRMAGGGGGGQIFSIGKSKAKLFDKDTHVMVTFDHVAGLDEAKVELMEIVEFLKTPKKYTSLGGKIPKGALLVGPPGTGKTLLAKAVAGEAKVPFFSLSGSDFVEMFVGVGASRVRDLFKQAKEKAPCIIFIDEIDAIGRARGRSITQGANDERENTLNQLLTEMDGFESNAGVIILAATNRSDVLDKALLRPGRFDRQIMVDLPDLIGRKEIFQVHLKPLKTDDSIDIDLLSKQTPGFSGADIANVCNEAALIAARKNKKLITREDFNDAIDRVIGGLEKKNKIISPEEKKVIAYHEAGHASVSWMLEHASPLVKVTIIPRGQSLGAAWYLPEERYITTREQLMDEMSAALGGRAAEEVVFGTVSTGALSDLEKVTKQAYAMVAMFGLNDKLGNISFYDSTGQSEYSFTKPYSEKTAELIDQEVKDLIDGAYQRAIHVLNQHREKLDRLAGRLLEKEILYREDLEEIFGMRKDSHSSASEISFDHARTSDANTTEDMNEEIKDDSSDAPVL